MQIFFGYPMQNKSAMVGKKHFGKMELLSHVGMVDHIALESWHTKG